MSSQVVNKVPFKIDIFEINAAYCLAGGDKV